MHMVSIQSIPRYSSRLYSRHNVCSFSRLDQRHLNTSSYLRTHDARSTVSAGKLPYNSKTASFERNCIVTGGSSGIGFQISKQLVLSGATSVIIVSRSAEKARSAIQRIKDETRVQDTPISFIKHDLNSDLNELLQGWRRTSNDHESPVRCDTLINCAGLTQAQGLLNTPSQTIAEILRVNIQMPIELSRELLKQYFALGKSLSKTSDKQIQISPSFCVVNVSSLLADRGGYGTSIYSTSKAGLTAFTRTLVLEAAAIRDRFPSLPPFRANVVVPGYVDTPMIESFSDKQKQELISGIPLQRYGTGEEIADAVMFLLKNEYANNTILNIDGGLSAK